MAESVSVGDWVQVENTVLEPGERAPGVPEDTQAVPLLMRIKGFALQEGCCGDEITVRTVIGREVRGKLVDTDPVYDHSFGRPIPELIEAGLEARKMLDTRGNPKRGESDA